MLLTLHTEGWFDAAHHLENYEGKCANTHGHTWKVEVWIRGDTNQLDKAGILWDFGNLKQLTNILDHPDEGDLNNIIGTNSTCENLFQWFYNNLKIKNKDLLFRLRIYEQLQPKLSYCEGGDF